ncbi:MAG: ATP-binding protein [Chloroflexi bacterium]|nr:ATP-binding protein [Chloroflexota bacterium]
MFVNRQSELTQFNRLYQSGRAELLVLYGRRRVGKTELLRVFCQGKPHIYFIATLSSDSDQLAAFSHQIWGFLHPEGGQGPVFASWEAAFRALAGLPGRPVVVLDEFTYLISGNKAVPSILQKVWDTQLKNASIMLVLCGSYIGMMESEVLEYRAPLYGRRTASTLLRALDFPSSASFFPQYPPDQRFLAWSILGGMPYYLLAFNPALDIATNIRRAILDPQTAPLYSEPRLLLMEELHEPRNYFSILRAIALGRTRLNEIALASGVGPASTVARYLDILQQMRLVTRRVPATESQPEKSKKGLYQIDDHFLRFWFRYVHPNQAAIDLGLADAILEQRIEPDLEHFAASAFEEAAREHVAALARVGKLPFLPERIGGWWNRESEIDVLAVSHAQRVLLAGECKWSVNPVGTNILENLKRKVSILNQTSEWQDVHYCLFSRSGFTPALLEQAGREKILLVSVDQMLAEI